MLLRLQCGSQTSWLETTGWKILDFWIRNPGWGFPTEKSWLRSSERLAQNSWLRSSAFQTLSWHIWWPTGLRRHVDQQNIYFCFVNNECLSLRLPVWSRQDESKCHWVKYRMFLIKTVCKCCADLLLASFVGGLMSHLAGLRICLGLTDTPHYHHHHQSHEWFIFLNYEHAHPHASET